MTTSSLLSLATFIFCFFSRKLSPPPHFRISPLPFTGPTRSPPDAPLFSESSATAPFITSTPILRIHPETLEEPGSLLAPQSRCPHDSPILIIIFFFLEPSCSCAFKGCFRSFFVRDLLLLISLVLSSGIVRDSSSRAVPRFGFRLFAFFAG